MKKILLVMVTLAGLLLLFTATTASATTTKTITAHAINDHECDSTEWHFVITQVDTEADAPASITVTYTDSTVQVIDLSAFTGHTAHYSTTDNLDKIVASASAVIYESWSGQFNLSHGPCGESTTTTSPGETTTTTGEGTTTTTAEGGTTTTTERGATTTTTGSSATTAPAARTAKAVTQTPLVTG